jgi:hypothetical protein
MGPGPLRAIAREAGTKWTDNRDSIKRTHFRDLATSFARVLQNHSPLKNRAQGRPGARCTRGLVCKHAQTKTHTSIQVQRKQSGLPCAMVLRLIPCYPRRSFLATVTPKKLASRKLDTSTEASGPHDFAVRVSAVRPAAPSRPSLPASNVRGDRETPLLRVRDGVRSEADLPSRSTTIRCDTLARRAIQQMGVKVYLTARCLRCMSAILSSRCRRHRRAVRPRFS